MDLSAVGSGEGKQLPLSTGFDGSLLETPVTLICTHISTCDARDLNIPTTELFNNGMQRENTGKYENGFCFFAYGKDLFT